MPGFISFERLLEFFERNKEKRFLFTFHSIGDRDGLASAMGLSQIVPNSVIRTPDYITNNAKRMLEKSGYSNKIESNFPDDIDIVVIADANRFELMGKFEKRLLAFKGEMLFIDHHAPPDEPEYGNKISIFNSEDYNSASSIICEIMKAKKVVISRQTAYALINGIVADSADFQNSNPLAFGQISELLGVTHMLYSEVVDNVHGAASATIRNRIMKDLFGSKTEVCGSYMLIMGEAQFQANTAAESALSIGADASVFWSAKEKEVSISARLRSPLDKELSLNLGKVLEQAGRIIHGTGGGHPCAAGAYGKKNEDVNRATQYVIDRIKERFISERKR